MVLNSAVVSVTWFIDYDTEFCSTIGVECNLPLTFQCRDFHGLNLTWREACEFVQNTSDCSIESGFLDYTRVLYCTFGGDLITVGLTILVSMYCSIVVVNTVVTMSGLLSPARN